MWNVEQINFTCAEYEPVVNVSPSRRSIFVVFVFVPLFLSIDTRQALGLQLSCYLCFCMISPCSTDLLVLMVTARQIAIILATTLKLTRGSLIFMY